MRSLNKEQQWLVQEQPAVKFENNGATTLTDAELLQIILNCRKKEKDAARDLLSRAGSLRDMRYWDIKQYMMTKGVGKKTATRMAAVFELAQRVNGKGEQKERLTSPQQVAERMTARLRNLPYEEFWVIFLNHANRIIGEKRVSMGGVNETTVDPKIIFKEALLLLATGIVLCHNHPSGNTKPSAADTKLTKTLLTGATALGIRVLDHIIVGEDGYHSFLDDNLI